MRARCGHSTAPDSALRRGGRLKELPMRTNPILLVLVCSTAALFGACSSGEIYVGNDQEAVRAQRDASVTEAAAIDAREAGQADASDAADAGVCVGPNPAGCISTGCPTGQKCVVGNECAPSACGCNSNGSWDCTADCSGGACVEDSADAGADGGPATCGSVPNPAGCVSTGCPAGKTCQQTSACTSSACTCDTSSNTWLCTPDCSGGECL